MQNVLGDGTATARTSCWKPLSSDGPLSAIGGVTSEGTSIVYFLLCNIRVLVFNGLAKRESMRLESPEFPAEREPFPPTVGLRLRFSRVCIQEIIVKAWWKKPDGQLRSEGVYLLER